MLFSYVFWESWCVNKRWRCPKAATCILPWTKGLFWEWGWQISPLSVSSHLIVLPIITCFLFCTRKASVFLIGKCLLDVDGDGHDNTVLFSTLECDGAVSQSIEVIVGHDPALFFMGKRMDNIFLFSSGATGKHLWEKGGLLSFG